MPSEEPPNPRQPNAPRDEKLEMRLSQTLSLIGSLQRPLDHVPSEEHKPDDTTRIPLRQCLEEAMVQLKRSQYFIPIDALDRLITLKTIRSELELLYPELGGEERSVIAFTTFMKAQKLFAILIFIRRGLYIKSFIQEGLPDADLPLKTHGKSSDALSHTVGVLYAASGNAVEAAKG
jgi:hypothetical protein